MESDKDFDLVSHSRALFGAKHVDHAALSTARVVCSYISGFMVCQAGKEQRFQQARGAGERWFTSWPNQEAVSSTGTVVVSAELNFPAT